MWESRSLKWYVLLTVLCAGPCVLRAAQPHAPRQNALVRSSGTYRGHPWYVDQNHLMWWDGQPYVPFGGFGITPGRNYGLNTHNLWIDFDPFISSPDYTRADHQRDIKRRLSAIREEGGTCIVQFSMALPHMPEGPRPEMKWKEPQGGIDASRLADPSVKKAIVKVWAEYAPAVCNDCVRALVLWNEINVWRWPRRFSVDDYAAILGEYVREAKRLVGDLPVCFKTAGTWNAAPAIAAAAAADGLGFDTWFSRPDDRHALREISGALRMLEARQTHTAWFFIAEGGRTVGRDDAGFGYPDSWPPFRSQEDARRILHAYARAGAKGFIYNGPIPDNHPTYRDSYRWLGELRAEVTAVMQKTTAPRTEARHERLREALERVNRLSDRVEALAKRLRPRKGTRTRRRSPGKILAPEQGVYLGQTELKRGDIAAFERAIGRQVAIAADLSVMTGQEEAGEHNLSFDVKRAQTYWERGSVVVVGAYEAYPGHKPFTVDKLLRGAYDRDLERLASQFRAFGKPMFFTTAREPNGVLAPYLGGFGPRGTRGIGWAERPGHGYAEFKPPAGPAGNPDLYAGLGDPNILDGIERLAAAQRYYYDFFMRRHGLGFLTFETMGWAVPVWDTDEAPLARFEDLYPLIADYADWISINFYMATEHEDEVTGRRIPEPPLDRYLTRLRAFMKKVKRLAPGKPVLLTELGFGAPNRVEKIRRGLREILRQYPQIKGVICWGDDFAIRPGTPEAAAFKGVINERPEAFHVRVITE